MIGVDMYVNNDIEMQDIAEIIASWHEQTYTALSTLDRAYFSTGSMPESREKWGEIVRAFSVVMKGVAWMDQAAMELLDAAARKRANA